MIFIVLLGVFGRTLTWCGGRKCAQADMMQAIGKNGLPDNACFSGKGDGRDVSKKGMGAFSGCGAFSAVVPAPFGAVGIVSDGEKVARMVFLPGCAEEKNAADGFTRAVCRQVAAYLADSTVALDFPVAQAGTVFQRRVWEEMRQIPPGQTRTYGEVARRVHSAPRAVGGACAANAMVLYYPCHRIVAAASLGGFSGESGRDGVFLRIKRWLLAHEGAMGQIA